MSAYQSKDKPRFNYNSTSLEGGKKVKQYTVTKTGDLSTGLGYFLPTHTNQFHEIVNILQGNASVVINGVKATVTKGDIVIIPKGTAISLECGPQENIRYTYVGFNVDDTTNQDEKLLGEFIEQVSARILVGGFRSAEVVFEDIFYNLFNDDVFSETLVADSLRKLLVSIKRIADGDINSVYIKANKVQRDELLKEIAEYICDHVDNIDALKDLPERFGYSYSYISRTFSAVWGKTLKEFFLEKRFERECELLRQGISVTKLAHRMGFSSIHALSHSFTAYCGMSPSEYANESKMNK